MKLKSNKGVSKKLLLGYFVLYPMYYVVAMLVATVILMFIFDWSFEFAEKIFYIFALIMWFVSYVAHFDILQHALSLRKSIE
jgi:hypothetical protein